MPLTEAIHSVLDMLHEKGSNRVEFMIPANLKFVGDFSVLDILKLRRIGNEKHTYLTNIQVPVRPDRCSPQEFTKSLILEVQRRRDKLPNNRIACLVVQRSGEYDFITRSQRDPQNARTLTFDTNGKIISDSDNSQV